MKKMHFLKLILAFLFVLSLPWSCTLGHLRYPSAIDPEVTQLIRNVPGKESYPDASIVNILDEEIIEISEDGRCRETDHVVFKILQDRGKDNGDIKIGFNAATETASIVYARTITPDGKSIPLNRNAVNVVTPFTNYPSYSDYKELTFSMPGVAVGSIIDYKVVRERQKSGTEGKFSDGFYFQTYEPTHLCRYKVITPGELELKYHVLNPLPGIQPSPQITRDGNKKIYLWEYRNIPQIFEEASMPPMDEVAFRVLVTTMSSWEEFSHWWRKKIAGKTEPDESIKRKVAELTKGLVTSREKVEAIFDYVKGEIRYVVMDLGKSGYEPENAKKVFHNKYGDCKDKSTLLISMLKLAGIPAYYVLIPTSSVGNLIKDFPYPFQFNHCIAAIRQEGKYSFLDPVAEDYAFNDLPGSDQNRDVLIFEDQKIVFEKTPLAKPEENAFYNQSQINIRKDGSMECEVKNFGFGGEEASLRSFFTKNTPTKIKESLEEKVDKISAGARLLTYHHSDPANFKGRFEVTFKYTANDYCKKAGDILIFDVPEIQKSCPATGKKDLKCPIELRTTSYRKDEVTFNVPEGYEIIHLPDPVDIKNQYFEFHSNYRKEGERIFYRGDLIRKAARINPAEYASYQNGCVAMEKCFNTSVLFRKKP